MSNARFRAGMVGAGNICEFHVAAVKKLAPEVELVGVTDLDAARAQANAEKWGTTAYKDMDALIAAGANVIHVLTPPAAHARANSHRLRRPTAPPTEPHPIPPAAPPPLSLQNSAAQGRRTRPEAPVRRNPRSQGPLSLSWASPR